MHFNTRSYSRSRKEDGGHAIRSAVADYPARKLHRCRPMCYRSGVIGDRGFNLRGSEVVLARSSTLREYALSNFLLL